MRKENERGGPVMVTMCIHMLGEEKEMGTALVHTHTHKPELTKSTLIYVKQYIGTYTRAIYYEIHIP